MNISNFISRAVLRATALLTMAGLAAAGARAEQVKLDVQTSNPLLEAGKKQTAYIKVGLTGIAPEGEQGKKRAPINVAIVLDKSGSMQSDGKIEQAREAAIQAIESLGADDIISVVTYDSTVNVLVPATKLAGTAEREQVAAKIRQIKPSGSTALFAGISKGADELRKFAEKERVSRVILLSDGIANVGPSAPGDMADLGTTLRKERISVTTIGLGLDYNADVMTAVAGKSDGGHYFVENANDLAAIYSKELGDVEAVVAQGVKIDIECAANVRPVRVLGRDAQIADGHVRVDLNQLYSGRVRNVLLEVEVPGGITGASQPLATVQVGYLNALDGKAGKSDGKIAASYSDSAAGVKSAINAAVMVPVVEMIGVENNERAVALRNQGDIMGARQMFMQNTQYLNENGHGYGFPQLLDFGRENEKQAQNLDEEKWKKQNLDSNAQLFQRKQ